MLNQALGSRQHLALSSVCELVRSAASQVFEAEFTQESDKLKIMDTMLGLWARALWKNRHGEQPSSEIYRHICKHKAAGATAACVAQELRVVCGVLPRATFGNAGF